MEKIHGIYVPGLGDDKPRGQDEAMASWQKHGLEMKYHPVSWGDKEPFGPKLDELVSDIDELHAKYGPVALVGASAGASAVLNAFAKRPDKVRSVVSICGKILNPGSLNADDFQQNPAFKESLLLLPKSLTSFDPTQLNKILSIRPLYDGRVPVADTKIDGAHEQTIWTFGHVLSIAYAISVGKRHAIKFIKQS